MKKLKVLSLFDGMSCGRIALDRAGIEVDEYYSSEIKEYAIKVADINHPEDKNKRLGDVTKIKSENLPNIDLLIGGSPCFVADTLIQTSNGAKQISDINVGDMVLTHKGNFKPVLKIGGKTNQQIWRVNGMGFDEIKTTYNHPFYTRMKNKLWNNKLRKYELVFDNPKWTNASSLSKQSYLASVYADEYSNPNKDSEAFWKFVGRFTADGWISKVKRKKRKNSYSCRVVVCCGKNEFHELIELFDNLDYQYSFVEERTVFKFSIFSEKLLNFMSQIKTGANNKIIHPNVWGLSIESKTAFLDGYIAGDGCYINKLDLFSITTASRTLAYEIKQLILQVKKITVKLYKHIPPKTTIIEGRVVKQLPIYQIKFSKTLKPTSKSFIDKNKSWQPMKKSYPTNEYATVYNIEVADDNSYTANGIVVHNCQDFSGANKKRLGVEGIKSGLFYEYVRLLKELNPRYFILENVRMKKEQQDIISKELGLEPLVFQSGDVTAQLRYRLYWTNIPCGINLKKKQVSLNDILDSGYSDKEKARALLESDSRPLATPIKMAHRYFNKGFTTLIFESKEHFDEVNKHFNKHFKGKSAFEIDKLILGMDLGVYDNLRYLIPIERERCQTVPEGYTSTLTQNESACLLGDGWTIDVITHIMKGINNPVKPKLDLW